MVKTDVLELVADALLEFSFAENLVDITDKELALLRPGELYIKKNISSVLAAIVKIITDNNAQEIIGQLPKQYRLLLASKQTKFVINIISKGELPKSVKDKIKQSLPDLYESSLIYSINQDIKTIDLSIGWQDISPSPSTINVSASYARGFIKLAKAFEVLDISVKELRGFSRFYEKNHLLQEFLDKIDISPQKKFDTVSDLLGAERLSSLTTTFLWLLIMQKKQGSLLSIVKNLEQLVSEEENRIIVDIYTAYKPSNQQKEIIITKICDLTGSEAIIDFLVDENLIGGIKIQLGYRIYDNTIASQLQKVVRELSNKKVGVS